MKTTRNLILLLLLLICNGSTFAQNRTFSLKTGETAQKNAIYVDLFPLMEGVWEGKVGAGFFYERTISNYFSLVAEVNLYSDFKDETAFTIMPHGRIYPFETTLGKLFADVGVGYRSSSLVETAIEDVKCIDVSASAGWKFIFGRGFVFEPSVGYRRSVHTFVGKESHPGGITINMAFGWAF